MKNFMDQNIKAETKGDMEGIKKDIEKLVQDLSKLKDHSVEGISEQVNRLGEVLDNFKEKGVDKGRDQLAGMCSYTRSHPLRSLIYAFGIGALTCWFLKK